MALTKASYSMITGSVVNILDYGAVADYNSGSGAGTDNSAAIQAAINAANVKGGAVFIPAGAYKIEAALNVPASVSIFGESGSTSVLWAKNCDGLNFTGFAAYSNNLFYEDFGIISAGGNNYVGVVTVNNAAVIDGLYFNRLRIQKFDTAFYFSSNWNCTVSNCVMEYVNIGVNISSNNGQAIGIRLLNNRIVYSGGGFGGNGPFGIYLNSTTEFTESIHIVENQIFGFSTNIKIAEALFVNIVGNDLSGSGNVIEFVNSAGGYNISYNYIEVKSTGIGIVGLDQAVETPNTRTVIASNYFQGTDGAAQIGIKMSAAGQYQWNYVIRDNTFDGFYLYDIQINNPGKCLVDNNRCVSTTTSNSIYAGTVYGAPVTLTNNYCVNPIYVDTAADYTSGKLILQNNVENDTLQPSKQSAAPTTGTWRVTDIVMNSAPASGQPAGWVCTVAGTPGTWKAMANLA